MKICILADRIPPESNGGAERVAWQSAAALQRRGYEVSLITTTSRPIAAVEEKIIDGIRIFYIHSAYRERWRSWRSLYNATCVQAIKSILGKIKPDIVHAHNIHYHLSYYALRLAKKSGAKVFLTAHDVMPFHYGKLVEFIDSQRPVCEKKWNYHVTEWQKIKRFKRWYNPFRNYIIRWYLSHLDGFFAVSDALREALLQNGMPNSTVLHTGIDTDDWLVSRATVDSFEGKFQLKGRRVILFGGRITRTKGGEQLLQALREVAKKVPSVLLLVASNPDSYLEKLLKQARGWDLENNVRCAGWLGGEELCAAYHAADVITVPSVCFDSFPLTNLEAMSCAKPVIATCFGGSPEAVLDGETGYIINPYDTATFAEKLADLLIDVEKKKEFGKRGYTRVKDLFSVERYITLLTHAYGNSFS